MCLAVRFRHDYASYVAYRTSRASATATNKDDVILFAFDRFFYRGHPRSRIMTKGSVNLEDSGHMTYDDSNVTYLSKPTGRSGEALRAEEW